MARGALHEPAFLGLAFSYYDKAPLTAQQRAILELWVVGASLEEIGKEFGLGRERIRQILFSTKPILESWAS